MLATIENDLSDPFAMMILVEIAAIEEIFTGKGNYF